VRKIMKAIPGLSRLVSANAVEAAMKNPTTARLIGRFAGDYAKTLGFEVGTETRLPRERVQTGLIKDSRNARSRINTGFNESENSENDNSLKIVPSNIVLTYPRHLDIIPSCI
jgi:hypothetical protein